MKFQSEIYQSIKRDLLFSSDEKYEENTFKKYYKNHVMLESSTQLLRNINNEIEEY